MSNTFYVKDVITNKDELLKLVTLFVNSEGYRKFTEQLGERPLMVEVQSDKSEFTLPIEVKEAFKVFVDHQRNSGV